MISRGFFSATSILFCSLQPVRASRQIKRRYLTVKTKRASTQITMKKHLCDLGAPGFFWSRTDVLQLNPWTSGMHLILNPTLLFQSVRNKLKRCWCDHGSQGLLNFIAKRFSSQEQQAQCPSIELADCSRTPLGNTFLFILDHSTSFSTPENRPYLQASTPKPFITGRCC